MSRKDNQTTGNQPLIEQETTNSQLVFRHWY